MKHVIEGGCLCGAIRYKACALPFQQNHCHCTLCRRASGAPFVSWLTWREHELSFTGSPASYQSSEKARRGFCEQCGSQLTFQLLDSDAVDITAGSLDHPDLFEPSEHIWVSSKLPWIHLADGLPQYPESRDS